MSVPEKLTTEQFATAFTDFITQMAGAAQQAAAPGAYVELLTDHFGVDPLSVDTVSQMFPWWRHADVDTALATVFPETTPKGLRYPQGSEVSFSELLTDRYQQFEQGALAYETMPVGFERRRRVITNGLWVAQFKGQPVAVLQTKNQSFGHAQSQLEIMCAEETIGDELSAELRRCMDLHSTLRGEYVTLAGSAFQDEGLSVQFHDRPRIREADVILPSGSLDRIRRHVLGLSEMKAQLREAGQHLKRGILLYGPPGTGKTHTVRHLIGGDSSTTVIVLTGPALGNIAMAAETARALQPALVVLEDCDLVAEDRDFGEGGRPLLFEILDTLDGLSEDADVAFVLTTNRAEVLEPALAQRPGRVDLAVEIPLPDHEGRLKLFTLYSQELSFSPQGLRDAADSTEGITASFAKEAIRRAVVNAAAEQRSAGDEDLRGAVAELLSDQDLLTTKLLASAQDWDTDGSEDFDEDLHGGLDE